MNTYKIIGADGKEYGPITAVILRQWIAEGRINGLTKVLPEGAGDWKPLAEIPELANALPAGTPPPAPAIAPTFTSATDRVNGPAIGLMVTGGLNIMLGCLRVVLSLTEIGLGWFGDPGAMNDEMGKFIMSLAGTAGAVLGALCVVSGGLTLFAGVKLRNLQSYGLCMTGCILGMIPCTSPCCLIGLPVGIWALVVMSKPEVKSQFP